MEAYVHGVSTRSVDDFVDALGAASGIKKSEVSRICAGLDDVVGAFRTRRLDHVEFPYVYLDATYLHVRNETGQVTSMAVVIATGMRPPVRARCSASTSATPRTKRSGAASCAPSRPRAGRGAARHLRPARRARRRPRRAFQVPAISAAGSTSPATCWPWPQDRSRHGRRRVPHHLRPARTRPPSRRRGPRSVTSSPTASPRSVC